MASPLQGDTIVWHRYVGLGDRQVRRSATSIHTAVRAVGTRLLGTGTGSPTPARSASTAALVVPTTPPEAVQ
jgi:hypothetical protein